MTYHRPTLTAGTQLEAHTVRKEAPMSDTPRTDAATRMAFSGEYMVPIQDAQKLERELAEVTKQRDELAALAATKGGSDA